MYKIVYATVALEPSNWEIDTKEMFMADLYNALYAAKMLARCEDIHTLYVTDEFTGEVMYDLAEDLR